MHSDVILQRLMALHPKVMDLSLGRVWRLLDAMGNPQDALPPVIHIAGTNGKGSTLAMIRAGLEATGCTVHAYTSPHLARFHERIRVAGDLIDETDLAELLQDCELANGEAPITFFEITTVAALVAFARIEADYTLLEVGLGGRLDATNVITPALSVITPVSIDHQQYLGETLAVIAGEKAGILKAGVPAVVGPQADQAREVIEAVADRVGAPLSIHGQDWMVRSERDRLIFEDQSGLLDLDLPSLRGAHQVDNAGTAIAALRQLCRGDAEAAVTRAEWPARMQRLRKGPLVDLLPKGAELWLDGGHNAAAGQAVAAELGKMARQRPAPLWLIAGMLETKSVVDFLGPFAAIAEGMRTVEIPESEASLSATALARTALSLGMRVKAAEDAEAALQSILAEPMAAPPRIVICGSLYLAGAILQNHG